MRSLTVAAAAALVLLPAAPVWAAGGAPVVVDDAVSYRNTGGIDYPVNALANDSDPDGDTLSYVSVTSASKGDAYLQGGQLYYKPHLGNTGTDTFTYTVTDGQGNTATGTVTATLWVDPPQVTGLAITGSATSSVTLTWTATPGAASYRIYRGGGAPVATTTSLTWTDSGLLPSSDHLYQVTAVNGGGWGGPLSSSVYRRPQQATPTGLVIDASDPTSLSLVWNGADSSGPWNVYRDGSLLATASRPEFTDTGLVTGREYRYQLQAAFPSTSSAVYPPSLLSGATAAAPGRSTPIAARFLELGGTGGVLGLVTVPEHAVPGGRRQDHQGGLLLQQDGKGAFAVMGNFAATLAAAGGTSGDLGFPLEDRECGLWKGGCAQVFEGGSIWYQPSAGTHVVWQYMEGTWDWHFGEVGRLGYPVGDEVCGLRADGCFQEFEGGSLYASSETDVRAVFSEYEALWAVHGWEEGRLGYPVGDEICMQGGCDQVFQGGTISWSPSAGMHAVYTPYGDIWARHGGDRGRLGRPITDESCGLPRGGCFQQFQGGTVHWSPASGMHAVFTPYRDAWARLGAENGRLGYPTTDEVCFRSGCHQQFQGGAIYWSPASGMHTVFTAYRDAWARVGAEHQRMGYPITDEICGLVRGGCYQQFQGGAIYWSPGSGVQTVFTPYRNLWARHGAENGRLGYPITDEVCGLMWGGCYQHFQGGSVYWSPASGMHPVWGGIRDIWARMGWETGLGYPVTGEMYSNGAYRQDFQRGSILIERGGSRIVYR